jgi:hypothetical protein
MLRDLKQPARRKHEGVAAGQNHFPDFGVRRDVGDRGIQFRWPERAVAGRADHLAAKAVTAVHRADVHQLQQAAVGVAVHDARDRRVLAVADRVGVLVEPA